MTRPTLGHRLEYLLFTAVTVVLQRLPERAALGVGALVGWISGSVFRIRRSVVLENLTRAFPEESASWRRRVATETYRHFGREGATLFRMRRLGPAQILERCEVGGLDLLSRAIEEGRGVVALTGHLGNWEMAGAATAASGFPLDVVAKRQANLLFDTYVRETRERLGMRVIYQTEAPRSVLRALRERRVVALVADQNVLTGGLFVEFFGEEASTARGPAVLAARGGAEVAMMISRRLPGPAARYSMRFVPVSYKRTSDPDENARRLLRAYHAILEDGIRAAPEQYFWFHKRWKTRPS